MADGLRVLLPGTRRGRVGGIRGPVLQHFLGEGARLVADAQFGLVGGAIGLTVALDDVENLLDALAQLRATGQTLVQTVGGPFPNGSAR